MDENICSQWYLFFMRKEIEFSQKVSSSLEDQGDKALAFLNFGEEMEGNRLDPAVPAFKALHLYQDMDDKNGIAQAAVLIARYLFSIDKFEHARRYMNVGLKALEGSEGNQKLKSYILGKLGAINFQLEQYEASINAYMECVELLEALGDLNEIPKIYAAMGFIYQDLDKNDEANQLFQKAADVAMLAGNENEANRYISLIL
ncbi:tetratricopeptide repeat protein [Candidatus Bathyarchaeota archaeon]|nr:tetratricopeptide repeat protein [Candidatus Bathyarchaeota archaeon]